MLLDGHEASTVDTKPMASDSTKDRILHVAPEMTDPRLASVSILAHVSMLFQAVFRGLERNDGGVRLQLSSRSVLLLYQPLQIPNHMNAPTVPVPIDSQSHECSYCASPYRFPIT
jgi:hypothetical protein